MPKRRSEPDEAIGPALDGLEVLAGIIQEDLREDSLPALEESPDDALLPAECSTETGIEIIQHPVVLICGATGEAAAVASLASSCGFAVELVVSEAGEDLALDFPAAQKIHVAPGYEDLVAICGIESNYFVCIFLEDALDCEFLLSQCLASDACYLGLAATWQKRQEVFAALRGDGAPDAELAAVCCPMGLNIKPCGAEQTAVGIVAELLAAKGGTLKRLRHDGRENRHELRK